MAEINDWNVAAASNNSTPPDGAPEGMNPSSVNDTIRENMAVMKRFYADLNGSVASTGSSNAYVVAANQTLTAYYDGLILGFDANHANTGAATVNVDALGAKTIKKHNDQDLASGDIEVGQKVVVIYDGTNFQLISSLGNAPGDLLSANNLSDVANAATSLSNIGGIGAATTDTLTNKTFDANGTGNSLSNVDVADLSNGTDGELITWGADAAPTTVAAGTSGQVLTSNGAGAAPTFQAAGGGGTALISRATFSGASSVDITGFASGTYDSYIIIIQGTVGTDNVNMYGRTSTDGGSTFDSGASDYRYAANYQHDGTTTISGANSAGAAFLKLNADETLGNAAGENFTFIAEIVRPDDTSETLVKWRGTFMDTTGRSLNINGAGRRASAADVDGFQFLPSSGTFSGSYQFIGIKKA